MGNIIALAGSLALVWFLSHAIRLEAPQPSDSSVQGTTGLAKATLDMQDKLDGLAGIILAVGVTGIGGLVAIWFFQNVFGSGSTAAKSAAPSAATPDGAPVALEDARGTDKTVAVSLAKAPEPTPAPAAAPAARVEPALASDSSPHAATRAIATAIGKAALHVRDGAVHRAMKESARTIEDIADLFESDPATVREAAAFLDYHAAKARDVVADYARLAAAPRLSEAEKAELGRVAATIAEMPALMEDHLHALRERQFLALSENHDSLRLIAFDLERPRAAVLPKVAPAGR